MRQLLLELGWIACSAYLLFACSDSDSLSTQAPSVSSSPRTTTAAADAGEQAWQIQALDFLDAQRGWVVYGSHLFATTNGGDTWRDVHQFDPGVRSISIASPDEWWTATNEALLHSTDGGLNWNARGPEGFDPSGVDFFDSRHGWTWSTLPQAQLYRTLDFGRTWSELMLPCRVGPATSFQFSFYSPDDGVAVCAGQPAAGSQLKRLAVTKDGGRSWTVVAEDRVLATAPAGLMFRLAVTWSRFLRLMNSQSG